MPRGFTWAAYTTDDGRQFAVRVDADQALDPARGWSTNGVASLTVLPRGFTPRRVFGRDPLFQNRFTRVGSTDAPLWTGSATTFTIEASDNQLVTVTVRGRTAERERRPH